MKPAYPELLEARSFITNVIRNEELRFIETLDTGLKLLKDTLIDLEAAGRKQIPRGDFQTLRYLRIPGRYRQRCRQRTKYFTGYDRV